MLDLRPSDAQFAPNLNHDRDQGCKSGPAVRHDSEDLMAKSNVIQIRLVSSADTGYFYVTKKNARSQTGKLELKKYDPVARKHVVFREAKIK
jgi:large subunit ribosomal protein L33